MHAERARTRIIGLAQQDAGDLVTKTHEGSRPLLPVTLAAPCERESVRKPVQNAERETDRESICYRRV